ncbi:MAG TPA: acyl-CoA synthetase [Micromonosporaceae bacterium]
MPDVFARVRQAASQVTDAFRSVQVLREAGLARFTRPDEMLRSVLAVRQLGPFAGAVKVAARRDPDAIGLVDELGELSFSQLDRRSNALARAWRSTALKPGDVIGLLCRDHRWFLDSIFAAAKLGARAVLLNTGFAGRQLADVVAREGIVGIVYDQEFTPLVDPLPATIRRYLAWVDDPTAVPDRARVPDRNAPELTTLQRLITETDDTDLPAPSEPGGIVLLTSGTTGIPKGAPRQVRSALAAAEFLDRVPYRRNEATLIASPLFHATGLSQFVMQLALACITVLARRFDPERVVALIDRYRCTGLVLVPTMLQRVLDLDEETLARYDTSSLRIVFSAGSALSPELGNRATKAFGEVLYNLYGSTEVAVATVATPADWRQAPGTVGRSPVGCRVRLYDENGNQITGPDRQGRIFVGSGLTFGGYTGGGTKEEIDGLLDSGDIGHFDATGLLFIDGRSDDMIVSGGENVYPGEVENILVEHEKISDAAVIGVPDAEFGGRLKAFVVPQPGTELTPEEVRGYVKAHLARFKVPRDVAFIDELPRNSTGKLLRHKLR